MSHELRTPLNAVLGFAQLLEVESTDAGQLEEIHQILEGGNHLLALIDELLDIARIEAGRLTVSLEDVDPVKLIDDAIGLIRPLADERRITVVRNLDACAGWMLRADAQRAKQVLLNLLSNATKYNRDAGEIAVTARATERGGIAIDVTDTGPGIAPEKLERLFEPFERVGAEYTGVDGAGIGLAVARQLSIAMGATLTVSSTVGEGSTFTVEFDASPVSRAAEHDVQLAPSVASDAPRLDILCIEDDVANLRLVERLIEKEGHFRLIGALTASLGLQLVREHAPALILLDLNLPDIPGEEVLRRLRADAWTASIPVVVLSADAMPVQIQRLLDQGAVAYLTKPLVLTEVLRVIREAVPSTPATLRTA
jgi:CheY-like chemotaxis protein